MVTSLQEVIAPATECQSNFFLSSVCAVFYLQECTVDIPQFSICKSDALIYKCKNMLFTWSYDPSTIIHTFQIHVRLHREQLIKLYHCISEYTLCLCFQKIKRLWDFAGFRLYSRWRWSNFPFTAYLHNKKLTMCFQHEMLKVHWALLWSLKNWPESRWIGCAQDFGGKLKSQILYGIVKY